MSGVEDSFREIKRLVKKEKLRVILAGETLNSIELVKDVLERIEQEPIKADCRLALKRWN